MLNTDRISADGFHHGFIRPAFCYPIIWQQRGQTNFSSGSMKLREKILISFWNERVVSVPDSSLWWKPMPKTELFTLPCGIFIDAGSPTGRRPYFETLLAPPRTSARASMHFRLCRAKAETLQICFRQIRTATLFRVLLTFKASKESWPAEIRPDCLCIAGISAFLKTPRGPGCGTWSFGQASP